MTKLLALVLVLAILVGNSVLGLIYGWGLTPQNWWAIVGFGVVGQILGKAMLDAVLKEDKKP
ncbi:MAG: hypothetical protein M3547_01040 [Acidobacteriota bacterium]|nr:hypothetical protein [Acidobacteriota bacterium]